MLQLLCPKNIFDDVLVVARRSQLPAPGERLRRNPWKVFSSLTSLLLNLHKPSSRASSTPPLSPGAPDLDPLYLILYVPASGLEAHPAGWKQADQVGSKADSTHVHDYSMIS